MSVFCVCVGLATAMQLIFVWSAFLTHSYPAVLLLLLYCVYVCMYWFCCQCRDDDAAPFATPKESPTTTTTTKKSYRSYHCALLLLPLLWLCKENFLEIGFATGRQKFLFNYQVLCVHTSRSHGHSNKNNNNNKNNAEKNSWLSSSTKSWVRIHTNK